MYTERVVTVVEGTRKPARCKFCGKAIEWAVTPKGKNIPLNASAIRLHTTRNPDTRVRFEVFGGNAVHIGTCPHWPKKSKTAPPTVARAWAGGRS